MTVEVHALDHIVARHEALRTAFVTLDGSPTQYIVPLDQARFHLLVFLSSCCHLPISAETRSRTTSSMV